MQIIKLDEARARQAGAYEAEALRLIEKSRSLKGIARFPYLNEAAELAARAEKLRDQMDS